MQDLERRRPVRREFRVEKGQFFVKRFSFRDAFKITRHHRHAITYEISCDAVSDGASGNIPLGGFGDGFFSAKTIEQLIAEQGIGPVADIGIFAGVIPDEDIEEFVADIYQGRLR
jgi:hypothetical protein